MTLEVSLIGSPQRGSVAGGFLAQQGQDPQPTACCVSRWSWLSHGDTIFPMVVPMVIPIWWPKVVLTLTIVIPSFQCTLLLCSNITLLTLTINFQSLGRCDSQVSYWTKQFGHLHVRRDNWIYLAWIWYWPYYSFLSIYPGEDAVRVWLVWRTERGLDGIILVRCHIHARASWHEKGKRMGLPISHFSLMNILSIVLFSFSFP